MKDGTKLGVLYTIDFKPTAADQLRALPPKIRQQIAKRVDALAQNPRPPGSKKLAGHDDLWRVRSGDFRIVYEVRDKVLLVLVVRVGNRREVYRGL